MRFSDIPRFTSDNCALGNYAMTRIPAVLKEWQEEQGLQTCPDFQRGRVWTDKQQIAYVEYLLRGGKASRTIYFNHPGWHTGKDGEFVLVDGLQRITAICRFIGNEIPAFGTRFLDFEDRLPTTSAPDLVFAVNDLKQRSEVLTWYLEMNSGGTPHTAEELERVRRLLEEERS